MNDKRLYGIDLFKALAMFLVVVLHVNTLGTAFDSSAPGSAQWWLTDGMMTAAYCCVDCFALATGFLMAERAFRPGRIVSLWLQVAFYAVVTTVVWYFAVPGAVGIKDIVSAFFPVLTSKYWYFSAYFVLFFFMPFINAMLHALDKRARAALLAAVFVFLSLLPTFRPLGVIPLSAGYCFFWLAALYIIGACIKLDRLYERASGKTFVLLYFASIAVMLLWQLVFGAESETLISYVSPPVLLWLGRAAVRVLPPSGRRKLQGRGKVFKLDLVRRVSYPHKPVYLGKLHSGQFCIYRRSQCGARHSVRAWLRGGNIRRVYAYRVPAAEAFCPVRH